jgi:ABC-type phosphate/phosphonate transport system permease subunit
MHYRRWWQGWYLKRNVMQMETERTAAILLFIIALVMIAEIFSAWARSRVARAK